jgi:hypothetical protein
MSNEPTPEDLGRDLEHDLAEIAVSDFVAPQIVESICRRAIAAERQLATRNTLATDLLHAERHIESLETELADAELAGRAVEAELAEAVRLLRTYTAEYVDHSLQLRIFLAKHKATP